ncbi:MAG: HPF/RaiA family ribosome-associated protein [Flavobacteriales bacterium]|nr:HPF/RaiA family ribosome-associated protein [Flavobacteriales bacterium]
MKIQFNTDKTISGNERKQEYFTDLIAEELDRFKTHITRIEVHLADENGKKEGKNTINCLLEARLAGRKPIAVSSLNDTVEQAISGAIEKLRISLESIIGRLQNH